MKIAVLGTGPAGRTVADRLVELGHEVALGTRDPDATLARTEPDMWGSPPLSTWLPEHPGIHVDSYAAVTADAELVVNLTNGAGSMEALRAAGEDHLAGKVILDVSNPLDFSHGMPPTLFVKDTDSLGEQLQRAFPRARVVKALNTMSAPVQARPAALAGGDHTVFVSGDDAAAKQEAVSLLEQLGHTDVIDLGDISTARGVEMYVPLWLRLWAVLGTLEFNIKVVR